MIADCIDRENSDRPQNEIEYEENSDVDDAGRIDRCFRPARRNECSKVSLLLIGRDAGAFERALRRDVGLLRKVGGRNCEMDPKWDLHAAPLSDQKGKPMRIAIVLNEHGEPAELPRTATSNY